MGKVVKVVLFTEQHYWTHLKRTQLTLRFTEPIFWRHLRSDVSPFTECGYDDDLRREVRANYGAEVFDAIYGG